MSTWRKQWKRGPLRVRKLRFLDMLKEIYSEREGVSEISGTPLPEAPSYDDREALEEWEKLFVQLLEGRRKFVKANYVLMTPSERHMWAHGDRPEMATQEPWARVIDQYNEQEFQYQQWLLSNPADTEQLDTDE